MANKLKIAKVSALAVLSDTTATTNVITVDSTTGLNIKATDSWYLHQQ